MRKPQPSRSVALTLNVVVVIYLLVRLWRR